jgi:hypothetical protein
MLPEQQISGIKSISKKKSKEKFVLVLGVRFPLPLK